MGVLLMVRHGQASRWPDDYDRLSELGWRQARLLGEHWAEEGARFDEVYVGPRLRHAQTEQAVADAFTALGLDWPEAQPLPELDEFAAEQVFKRFVPELVARDAEAKEIAEALKGEAPARARAMELLLRKAGHAWARGELDDPEIESWKAFRARVESGVLRIVGRAGSGRRVVAFTSGGPVASTAASTLSSPDEAAFGLTWVVRNSGQVELLFSGDRLTMRTFNAVPHLTDPQLVTYR